MKKTHGFLTLGFKPVIDFNLIRSTITYVFFSNHVLEYFPTGPQKTGLLPNKITYKRNHSAISPPLTF